VSVDTTEMRAYCCGDAKCKACGYIKSAVGEIDELRAELDASKRELEEIRARDAWHARAITAEVELMPVRDELSVVTRELATAVKALELIARDVCGVIATSEARQALAAIRSQGR
jgi:hypothetical protein